MKKNFSQVEGYFFKEEAYYLQELGRGKVCLEIGSFKGKSTVAIAETAAKVYAVDTFAAELNKDNSIKVVQNKGKFHQPQEPELTTYETFLANTEGYDNIVPVVGKSWDVIPEMTEKFDVIFIDGLHTKEGIIKDVRVTLPRLKGDGFLVFHDYGNKQWPDVAPTIHSLFSPVKLGPKSLATVRKSSLRRNP